MAEKEESNQRRLKIWLGFSLALNVLLLLFILLVRFVIPQIADDKLGWAHFKYAHSIVCEDNYEKNINALDNEEQRRHFATITCGKHLETGESLDFSPVLELIYETDHELEDIESLYKE